MTTGRFRFERFVLDPRDRQLTCDGVPVELNARYLDALALLVREQGRLVSKDRFLEEVWRGVPVTDEALTQCIKTLRRQLGDNAARPRFIETVVKHGYRFIAPVEHIGDGQAMPVRPPPRPPSLPWRQVLWLGGAGTAGAGVAGLIGGLIYGIGAASRSLAPETGAVSVLLVVVCLTVAIALIGGAGVSFGIALASLGSRSPSKWSIPGGAAGGVVVGAGVKLLGLDAFNLLFGQSPGNITGAPEGAWLAGRGAHSLRRGVAVAAAAGGVSGVAIPLLGGHLMAGSLDLLARQFADSRLRLDQISGLFGETGFGPVSQTVTGGLEGALFGGCIVGAMLLARRSASLS